MRHEIVCIDVGNSRYHVARYGWDSSLRGSLHVVPWRLESGGLVWCGESLDRFPLEQLERETRWWFLISVHRGRQAAFLDWLVRHRPSDRLHRLAWPEFQVALDVEYPERLGLDRIAAARAVLELRQPGTAAIVVDVGTAVTVDLVDEEGVFRGGAIFPGIRSAATALHQLTDALPLVATIPERAPAVVGRHTQAAIAAGLYHGMRGAICELVATMSKSRPAPPQVFLTGYEPAVDWLRPWHPQWVPDLVLRGVALAAQPLVLSSPQAVQDTAKDG